MVLGALFLSVACGDEGVVSGQGSSGPQLAASPRSSDEFGALPDFRLTAQDGRVVTRAELLGHPLVLGALFSTCNGPCPTIARSLAQLQTDLAATDTRLVVVSVDPEADSPEVLARYGERFGADPARWLFLTGELAEVTRLVREGLLLPFEVLPEGEEVAGDRITHDTRLLAIDRAGQRRGWYQGLDSGELELLRKRMLFLDEEER
jgi:protein SCO1/2